MKAWIAVNKLSVSEKTFFLNNFKYKTVQDLHLYIPIKELLANTFPVSFQLKIIEISQLNPNKQQHNKLYSHFLY